MPLAALLFGALLQGTSTRNPAIQDVIKPELAGNLTLIIQGLVLLFIGADVLFLYIWQLRKKARRRGSRGRARNRRPGSERALAGRPAARPLGGAPRYVGWAGIGLAASASGSPCRRSSSARRSPVHPSGVAAALRRLGGRAGRAQARLGWRSAVAGICALLGLRRDASSVAHLDGA